MRVALVAATAIDSNFVYEVNRDAMREYVEAVWGWHEDEQRRAHDRDFCIDGLWVIQADRQPVGFVQYEQRDDAVWLARIAIRPDVQGRGIGSQIVAQVQELAASQGLPVRLRVLEVNRRARALYERLGFKRGKTDPPHAYMEAAPPP